MIEIIKQKEYMSLDVSVMYMLEFQNVAYYDYLDSINNLSMPRTAGTTHGDPLARADALDALMSLLNGHVGCAVRCSKNRDV